MYIVELGRDVCMYVTGALNDNLSSMAPNTVNSYIKLNIKICFLRKIVHNQF